MARTQDELKAALSEQMDALRISAEAYDKGTASEAKRIAATVYILVHDGRRQTTSILTQLGALEEMQFLASGMPVAEQNLAPQMHLTLLHAGSNAAYLPAFDNVPQFAIRWLNFSDWWEDPVLRDQYGHTLTRKELVLTLRDQEGGSHFDEELRNPSYIAISGPDFGWQWVTPEGEISIDPRPHLATMRQIGWELEQSIEAANLL